MLWTPLHVRRQNPLGTGLLPWHSNPPRDEGHTRGLSFQTQGVSLEGQCQQMEMRLLTGPRPHHGDTSMQAGFPVTETGRKSPRPSLRWESVVACKHQVPSSGMGDNCLMHNTNGNSAECREAGRRVLTWDPEPGGRRNPSAFVLRLKRPSPKVSLKTA